MTTSEQVGRGIGYALIAILTVCVLVILAAATVWAVRLLLGGC